MDNLTKAWSCLTLSDREGSDLRLEEEEATPQFTIATKFYTKRALNIDTIAQTFNPIRRSRNGFTVKKEEDHIILFTSDNKEEMEKILFTEPWSFDKNIMAL